MCVELQCDHGIFFQIVPDNNCWQNNLTNENVDGNILCATEVVPLFVGYFGDVPPPTIAK